MDVLIVIAVLAVLFLFGKNRTGAASPRSGVQYPAPGRAGGAVVDALDNFTEAIARKEGFYVANSKPQRTNNPGMIGGDYSTGYPTPGDGWDALQRDVSYKVRKHPEWDVYDFFRYYLTGDTMGTPGPGQDPDLYAEQVANYIGAEPTDTLGSIFNG